MAKESDIRLLIVDDHPLFRRGVRFYLDTAPGISVVAEADSGRDALDLLGDLEVDVVMLDLQMPGLDGIETTRRALQEDPGARILILTSFGSWDRIHGALRAGAAGYVLKDAQPEELEAAIRAVAAGGSYLDARATEELLHRIEPAQPDDGEGSAATDSLSDREREVLTLLTRGLGNRDISEQLVVSEKTVKSHLANIMAKLGVKNRTQAALLAMREGLVPKE